MGGRTYAVDWCQRVFGHDKPIIGMIHLSPLLGYDDSPGLPEVIARAEQDLHALLEGGANGAIVENDFDQPHSVTARPETIASMTRVASRIVELANRASSPFAVGVQILLNDPIASLAVAKASEAHFIRTDYFVDRLWRHVYGGEMRIDPAAVIAYRDAIGAQDVAILADVQVKYAVGMDTARTLADSAKDAAKYRADAMVVTGSRTGDRTRQDDLREVVEAEPDCPVLIGSGLSVETASTLLTECHGAIVGSALKEPRRFADGSALRVDLDAKARVVVERVRALVAARDRIQ